MSSAGLVVLALNQCACTTCTKMAARSASSVSIRRGDSINREGVDWLLGRLGSSGVHCGGGAVVVVLQTSPDSVFLIWRGSSLAGSLALSSGSV